MKAWLIEAKRTPIGRSRAEGGYYADLRADELLAQLITKTLSADVLAGMPKDALDDVYIGCVGQHLEQGKNIARLAALLARLPYSVPGTTINRLCGSALQALNFAAATLRTGQAEVLLAGGVEHMLHVPMTAALDYHQGLLERFPFPFTNMGLTAERVAQEQHVSRLEQDAFALESQRRAAKAQASGWFNAEIMPMDAGGQRREQDQCPRPTTSAVALAGLKPAFKEQGTVTAGNSAPISDGASLTLLASTAACSRYGFKPLAEIVDATVVGVDPCEMGMGPVPAVKTLLQRNGLVISDIDSMELNEAFASQAVACMRALDIPSERVNPAGGAIALGHPLGCTGTRLIATLINNLQRCDGEFGIASLCVGHGQGMATLIRRCAPEELGV